MVVTIDARAVPKLVCIYCSVADPLKEPEHCNPSLGATSADLHEICNGSAQPALRRQRPCFQRRRAAQPWHMVAIRRCDTTPCAAPFPTRTSRHSPYARAPVSAAAIACAYSTPRSIHVHVVKDFQVLSKETDRIELCTRRYNLTCMMF